MRTVFNTGKNVCGDSSRMTVKNTSPPNASDLPPTPGTAGAASTSGRHQIAPALLSIIAHLPLRSFLPGHANRLAEDLQVVEAGVLIPAGRFPDRDT